MTPKLEYRLKKRYTIEDLRKCFYTGYGYGKEDGWLCDAPKTLQTVLEEIEKKS